MGAMLATSPELGRSVTSVITGRYAAQDWEAAFAETRSGQGGQGDSRLELSWWSVD